MLAKGEQEHERPSSAGMPLPKVIVPLDELDAAMVTEKLLWEGTTSYAEQRGRPLATMPRKEGATEEEEEFARWLSSEFPGLRPT